MSTEYYNTTSRRFLILARIGEDLYHAKDLANLWQIKDKNNLYTTLKRYTQKGLLIRIHKGFYALKDIDKIHPFLLGIKSLNDFAYVSTETVLTENGIIFQSSPVITLVSSKSKKFSLGKNFYQSRKLNDKFLHNTTGITSENGFYNATTERAIADLLYFNPNYYFDGKDLIDWEKVKNIQIEIGYKN